MMEAPGVFEREQLSREPVHDERLAALRQWLAGLAPELGLLPDTLRPASSDASFRRYFRLDTRGLVDTRRGSGGGAGPKTVIVMDAPPPVEDTRPYLHVARLLAQHGLHVPSILAEDVEHGFLLLSDLGSTTYADALVRPGVDVAQLYDAALRALVRLQRIAPDAAIPPYDQGRLRNEMQLFPHWYVERHLGVSLSRTELGMLEATFTRLADAARAQTQVLVHRDFHCRNLMVAAERTVGEPGILDFQDAVVGAVTYDLVSLLRDAYVEWPEAQQIDWAARYWEMARRAGIGVPAAFDEFWRALEWMGLQRSLKILGIFARLCYRDGKPRYLADLPLVLRHTQRVAQRYDALAPLARLLARLPEPAPSPRARPQAGEGT